MSEISKLDLRSKHCLPLTSISGCNRSEQIKCLPIDITPNTDIYGSSASSDTALTFSCPPLAPAPSKFLRVFVCSDISLPIVYNTAERLMTSSKVYLHMYWRFPQSYIYCIMKCQFEVGVAVQPREGKKRQTNMENCTK